MQSKSTLRRSIMGATAGHFLFQACYFILSALSAGIPVTLIGAFAAVSGAVHVAFGAFLVFRAGDFVRVRDGQRLDRINLANVLTMFRISSVPTILFLVFLSTGYATVVWVVVITAISFLSDFADGRISRSRGEITRVGRYLDSTSDYTILAAVAIAFVYFELVSAWFFWLLMFRLAFQVVGMAVLFVYQGGHVEPRSSFLGKASVFAAMVVFAVSLLTLFDAIRDIATAATVTGEIIASAVIAVSVGDKAVLLYKDFRDAAGRIRRRESS